MVEAPSALAAARLVELGFAVCEVAPPLPDGTCSCRMRDQCPSPGKHAVGRAWMKSALGRRARWDGKRLPTDLRFAPAMSYGLIPVPGSGLIVIDRDDPSVGLPMPPTFEVHRTSAPPGRGHYYFRLADDVGESEVPRAFAGGEVRVAASGHVVGPGCRHASGDLYEPNDTDVAIADRELIDALRASPPVRRGRDGAVEAVEGSRHAWLVGQARKLAGWGWEVERIEDELRELNETICTPPLLEREAEFGRMAAWAEANIPPDRAAIIKRVKRPKRTSYWTPEPRA
jgi:hypothetical protein